MAVRRSLMYLALATMALLVVNSLHAEPAVRAVAPKWTRVVVSGAAQPLEYRYVAFPTLLRTSEDEVWIAYKAGQSHATDAGAALEIVRHSLSAGATKLIQRLPAPAPKLYQMGELVRFPDRSMALYIDVQSTGWDGRHYRSGAEVARWNPERAAFDAPQPLGPINGVLYGYPLDFTSVGTTTWQLIMAFGYHLPGGRWSVDALRSGDSGSNWTFARNLTAEFGGIQANESGFVRDGNGFIVATRGYDRIQRLHRTDGEFRVQRQLELTGRYSFLNSYIGRPRVFIRDGHGYLIGRNWTRPTPAKPGAPASEMQLCLLGFDLATLDLTSCVALDNAEQAKVSDGYYAVTAFSDSPNGAVLHVFTYKAMTQRAPDIIRFDYTWADVK